MRKQKSFFWLEQAATYSHVCFDCFMMRFFVIGNRHVDRPSGNSTYSTLTYLMSLVIR